MPYKRSPGWRIYKEQMSQLDHGDALWEPAPLDYFARVQLGDVGFVRRGCFHLLFSAGCPLGERQPGADVPLTFEQLTVGRTIKSQPRLPGYLSTNTVQETGAGLGASVFAVPMLEPGFSISFQLTEKQGAALVTKYPTYREDVQREQIFEEYTKRHYDSWVKFARGAGYGNEIKPVLVTGVDMTRDFAMMSYSNNGVSLSSEFTTSVPGVASASVFAWGTWRTEGLVHTTCGPQLCYPPSSTQTVEFAPPSDSHAETVSDGYNQCVFVRYYTVRKRPLLVPKVIKAAAGPHDLGPGGHDGEESLLEAESSSDLGSDVVSDPPEDDSGNGDRSSVTTIDPEYDAVIHNTTADERDNFDVVADYFFQNSDADSVLLHHRDIALLREPGSSKSVYVQLLEKQPPIIVDESGVGKIVLQGDPSVKTWPDDQFGINPPTSTLVSSEIVHKVTSEELISEPRFPSHPECPPQCTPDHTQGLTTDAGSPTKVKEPIAQWRDRVPEFYKEVQAHDRLSLHYDESDNPLSRRGHVDVALKDGLAEPREDRMSQVVTTFQGESPAFREGEEKRLSQFERATANWKPARIKTDPTTNFWTVYKKVADEHDNDLVSTRFRDLDNYLLFAGLFLAVTSLFIGQIIPGPQPNPADLTYVPLLRPDSFSGTDPLTLISNIPIGTVSARFILFASFFITLFVAFIAVLGKQWILYYTRVTTWGNIVDRGKERQAKLAGLHKWRLHLVMEFLPVMLQFALLLFGIALVIYLWDLNASAAKVVSVVTSFGFALYVCTTVAATLWRDCPFQTPLSVLFPKVLPWAKEFTALARVWFWSGRKRSGRQTKPLGRAFKIFAGGTTRPAPPSGDTPTAYSMTLSNRAFWRDHPLFTSPIPEDIAASAGLWLLESSTDFSVAAAVAAAFSEFQWPSHHRSSIPLIRLRDMYVECFRAPEFKESTRLKALQSAAAYYVLYHTQLIWSTWKSLEAGAEIEELPSDLPPDLFLHRHIDEWNGDDVFEYLLHIKDRSESVESAQFLSYIAPYWFCGDTDPTIRFRPSRLQTLNELIEALEKSQALTRATITNCVLCAGAAMDFPLHPEDLIRVDKSDYLVSTFKSVVEHIHKIALENGRRHRYANPALEIIHTLAKKASLPLFDAVWINDLLMGAAREKMDDETFTALLRFSAHRKEDDATMDSGIPSGQDCDNVRRDEAKITGFGDPSPEHTLFDQVLRNVGACGAQKDGWQDDAVYGGLVAIRDIPGLRYYLPEAEFLVTLSKAMEKAEAEGENKKGCKPFRVRKAAYDVMLAARDGWLRSPVLRKTLVCLDFPRKLHSTATETFRSDHQSSFLGMMEILSEDRYWHSYLRREMEIWLPLHREGPVHALHILTNVGELLLPGHSNFGVDKSLEEILEDEWAAVPGRPSTELTTGLLEPLAEVTRQFKDLLFFTESGQKAVLGMVERVIPSLESRHGDGYDFLGDGVRRIIDSLLETLREPMPLSSRRPTYW